jgi:OOP family OmpA-OmpF porin
MNMKTYKTAILGASCMVAAFGIFGAVAAQADETANRKYLAKLYFDQGINEDQDWDIQDKNYLQGAGVNALNGGIVAPRDWREVKQVTATPQELEAARTKLNYAISSGAVNTMPMVFSHAIVAYDCWVGQQKAEPNASHNMSDCKGQYYKYASQLPDPMVTQTVKSVEVVPVSIKELHKVYFAWDSYALTPDAKTKLDQARTTLTDAKTGKLVIGGHADKSGPENYNMDLSRKRAQAVGDYLGLSHDQYDIEVSSYGEEQPLVPTADGVREQGNRVVIIGVRTNQDVQVEKTQTIQVKPEAEQYGN